MHVVEKVGEWYGLELSSSIMGGTSCEIESSYMCYTELACSHDGIFDNGFYDDSTAQSDTKSFDCGEKIGG